MTEGTQTSAALIPNADTDAAPENFSSGPAEAIVAAFKTNPSVKIVLNDAQHALINMSDDFTRDVGVRAVEIAGARKASAVDVPDVVAALAEIRPKDPERGPAWAWGVLGIVAGGLLSLLITLVAPNVPNDWKGLVTTGVMVAILICGIWGYKLVFPKRAKKI